VRSIPYLKAYWIETGSPVLKSAASMSLYRSRHNAASKPKAEFGRDGILTLLEGAVTLEAADVRLIVAVFEPGLKALGPFVTGGEGSPCRPRSYMKIGVCGDHDPPPVKGARPS
jgi:hypothetical protein